ncbi:hypothetical protein HOO68_04715 [Candidatus Gracilibacteria bacterium]|nr:hypothetical protein [Candidatus Gracilibacteria bacterium]
MNNILNNIYHLGLDELELYCSFPMKEDIILEFQRNGYVPFKIGIFEVNVIDRGIKGYRYKLIFSKGKNDMFAFYQGKKNGAVFTKDYLCIYSTGIRVLGLPEVLKIIQEHFIIDYKYPYLSRFDISVDILLPIKDVLKKFKIINQTGAEFYDSNGGIQTKYIGKKKETENRNSLIRIYDKIADIKVKDKYDIFSDYLKYPHVTRVELEIRQNLAKNITLEEILVEDNLKSILAQYVGKHSVSFESISDIKISLYKKIQKEDIFLTRKEIRKTRKMKMFIGLAKSLQEHHICPVEELLREGIFEHKVAFLVEKVQEVKIFLNELRREFFWEREVLSLLDEHGGGISKSGKDFK